MSVTVFHCADIHLDAPFSLSSPVYAEKRRLELRSAFTSAILYARQNGAQLFLISGDLFDTEYVTRDTAEILQSAFASMPSCRFFISPGNHDPFDEDSLYHTASFPSNVFVFGPEKQKVDLPELGVCVYGVGFGSDSMITSPLTGYGKLDPERINICVCHGDVGNPTSHSGPITRAELATCGFDYVALGHIHKPSGLQTEGNTTWCYPGCIEGRSFDEPGYHGAMFGTVEKGSATMKAVQFSKTRYETVTIDISGVSNKTFAIENIRQKIRPYASDTALRIILTGTVNEGYLIHPSELGKGYEYPYYIDIIDRTVPAPELTELETDTTLKGIFYKKMREVLESSAPDSEEYEIALGALKYGIGALEDRAFIDFDEAEEG